MCSTTTRTRESVMPLLSLSSLIFFNPLKLYSLSGNIFRKWFRFILLFIHEHVKIMLSPMVTLITRVTIGDNMMSLVVVTTLLLASGLHRC